SDEIRRTFVEFFGQRAHSAVPSSPVVPHNDPTLLFTNAGMNQFKPIFLGQADPGSDMGRLKRAVNSQKCIRAGGKHNDLDDVGKDTYHHTFFEMLGNWSFGDYFKKEAVDWSWELLTKVYGINPDALYATYFGGNTKAGIAPDLETRELWLKYLPAGRVLPGNMKDNFWMMGDTGPCGPCTEIHVDRITAGGQGKRDAADLVNSGDPMVLEIWNNVFIQFNAEYPADGAAALLQWDTTPEAERGRLPFTSRADIEAKFRKLITLPAKHVDTGMGFERLVSVIKGVGSNYDTDVFAPLFVAIERGTHAAAYTGRLGAADVGNKDTAYRVIADHIRTLTFAITDGAIPGNEGRGYVLRRILRRAVRYGRQCLGAKPGFFSSLVPVLVDQMAPAFPELAKDPRRVAEIIKGEEESFARTLDRGIVHFDEASVRAFSKARLAPHHQAQNQTASTSRDADGWTVAIHEKEGHKLVAAAKVNQITAAWANEHFGPNRGIAGEDAFKLYDTYGFPLDLTKLMAEERGLNVDEAGFAKLMAEAKEKARTGGKFVSEQGDLALTGDAIARLRAMNVAPTDDSDKFHGREVRATVKAIWNGTDFDDHVTAAGTGLTPVVLILDKTSFYAEMGGQVGDTGRIEVLRAAGGSAAMSNDDDDLGGPGSRGGRENGGEFRVEDTKAYGGYIAHLGKIAKKDIKVGDEVLLKVDPLRRGGVSGHHTATHLLNLGLRAALGEGVEQKGSLVADDRLRFDFSHGKPVAPEELARIEQVVQSQIKSDFPVYTDLVPLAKAKTIKGVRAVFGEAYPDPVRVVSIGRAVDHLFDASGASQTSAEFCGGVHVSKTGDIGDFCLVSEEGVAKGIRRLTALSGVPAKAAIMAGRAASARLDAAEKLTGDAFVAEVKSLVTEIDQLTIPLTVKQQLRARVAALQEQVKQAGKAASGARAAEVAAAARSVASSSEWEMTSCIITTIEAGSDRDALNAAVNTIRELRPRHGLLLISPDQSEGKLTIVAAVPDALQKRGLKAGDWVREAAAACGGRGGGRPDIAQGGGTDLTKVKEALSAARTYALGKCPV
ncbi:MAG TPA: alanine--tRNA ligase, partial [Phycisphaerales bacterium]|nr:alanine--tRNA ligase [Phycisphaerales bacterium]